MLTQIMHKDMTERTWVCSSERLRGGPLNDLARSFPVEKGIHLRVKSSDTNPFLIKSPSEALEGSISMAVFCNRCVNLSYSWEGPCCRTR